MLLQTGLLSVLTLLWGNPTKHNKVASYQPRNRKRALGQSHSLETLFTFYDNCRESVCFLLLWKKEGLPGFPLCPMDSSFSPITLCSAIPAAMEPQYTTAKDIPSYMTCSRPEYEPLQHALICLASFFPLCLHPRSHWRKSMHQATKESFWVQVRQQKKSWCVFFSN